MVINTNLPAQSSARLLSDSSNCLAKSLQRLSSGSKIISPEDDAAGMAVSMKFDAQVSRIGAAQNNVNNAISFAQTQDGFMSKVATALNRMSELSILAQDATKTAADDQLYNQEFAKLASYINDVATKDFNGVSLFNGVALQVTSDSEGKLISMNGVNMATYDLSAVTIDTSVNAIAALTAVKDVLTTLATDRAGVGANISVLNSYSQHLGVLRDNLSAANSRIKDVDVAEESATYAKYNILVQAGTAMLAQANQAPNNVLKLLQ
jgi:flagellin